jgi:c-di-GMP-binding flagellar brake protein YcgR
MTMLGVGSPVNLTHMEEEFESRVEVVDGNTVIVAAPLNTTVEPPELGSILSLGWAAEPRGQYVADARLVSTSRVEGVPIRCWSVSVESEPVLHQRRRFVRAGGGEAVRVRAKGRDVMISGHATDVSEGGVRFKVCDPNPAEAEPATLRDGEPVTAVLQLGDDTLDADGCVLRTIDNPTAKTVDVIVTLQLSERQAQMVRRYVLRQQVLARRVAGDVAY